MAEGKLEKLTVEAWQDPKYQSGKAGVFAVLFNPKSYAFKYAIEYGKEQGKGTSSQEQRYAKTKSRDLTLQLMLDGTGASGPLVEVKDKVEEFLAICYRFDGKIHRPPYLKIHWGSLLFNCVLSSVDVTYTLFRPDGTPLRATLNASFAEFVDEERREGKERASSPDLTHRHTLTGRESLPWLCFQYYGSDRYYLRVAEANGLVDFRNLSPGMVLVFPPIQQLSAGDS